MPHVEVVLDALPGRGTTRAQLAAKTLGDAHALDNGRPAAAVVLAVWRAKAVPKLNPHEEGSLNIENENGDERIRDVWAKAGVLVNELARPALSLNLSMKRHATLPIVAGEPTYASLRVLLRSNPCERPGRLCLREPKFSWHCSRSVWKHLCANGVH